ncbi:MAG: TonB family protein [Opitutaceae bacterium]
MDRRFLPWLLMLFVLAAGCSRKTDVEASAQAPAAADAVVTTEAPESDPGPAGAEPGMDDFGPVVNVESVDSVASDGSRVSQITPLNVDEGREVLVQSPQPLVFFAPFYPFSKRMEGIEGQVVLQFVIDRSGRVVNPTVSASTVPEFNEYAVAAARDWRFLPALVEGKPIDLEVAYPVTFASEKGSVPAPPNSVFARLNLIFDTYYVDGPDGYEKAEFEVTPIYRQVPLRPEDEDGNPIAGRVLLTFTVTTEGQVRDARVVESTDTRLEMPALTAIKYWQFIPRIREGMAVEGRVQQPITFNPVTQ